MHWFMNNRELMELISWLAHQLTIAQRLLALPTVPHACLLYVYCCSICSKQIVSLLNLASYFGSQINTIVPFAQNAQLLLWAWADDFSFLHIWPKGNSNATTHSDSGFLAFLDKFGSLHIVLPDVVLGNTTRSGQEAIELLVCIAGLRPLNAWLGTVLTA